MRLPVLRLIAFRELRDLLRDRRSVLLLLVTPVVLYPFLGLATFAMAKLAAEQKFLVGIVGKDRLPPTPLLTQDDQFVEEKRPADRAEGPVGDDAQWELPPIRVVEVSDDPDADLRDKKVDVLLKVPEGFAAEVAAGRKPKVIIEHRDGDEKSKLASRRLRSIVLAWKDRILQERFTKAGLPTDYDQVFDLIDPITSKPKLKQAADAIRDGLSRALPFLLMMWLLAGAIQPAVDLTAGEKERGTMETLLISPADRSEIVYGKFFAVTVFSFGSVVWNVIWLTAACTVVEFVLGYPIINKPGLIGCVVLGFPLAMLFSAICLSLGVFARSTKEGQYYLVPLILVAMPLALWSMMPGKELDFGNALIPVTGAMLMQQKLLAVSADPIPWGMFGPVLGSLCVCVVAALYTAVRQFRREDVLFREVGGDKGGKLFRLFS
ncbi:ABC transporter permease [Limnoglobus roseus]|uniref:ABC transporter permease n=1 Tax=Limnoglobus roseus TaxID=2598579 RepID=A0A5C1A918_9BACT|nr:ABC transporter permease [Limnoglobus roseus]QEL15859.1 ABC transporter permease [Limnoglobus roseus]